MRRGDLSKSRSGGLRARRRTADGAANEGEEKPPRRCLGEVVGCIVGNGNSRDTKSTVQLANFPGRRRCDVAGIGRGNIAPEDSRDPCREAEGNSLRRRKQHLLFFYTFIFARMYKSAEPCALNAYAWCFLLV